MAPENDTTRPLLVELVGPAGVGKSALAERLTARSGVVRASVWNLPRWLLLESAARSLPLLLRLCYQARAVPARALQQVVRLNALYLFVRRRVGQARVVVLDEGPVFALSWLQVFGHPRLRPDRTARWWRRTYAAWAAVLDRLIVLDAAAPVLAARLRHRRKPDDVYRRLTTHERLDVMARYHVAFARVLDDVVAAGGPAPLKLAATEGSVEHLGDRVLGLGTTAPWLTRCGSSHRPRRPNAPGPTSP